MSLLARDDVGPVEADRGELARRLLPTVLKTAATMLRDRKTEGQTNSAEDALLRRILSVLLDMVRQMSENQYSMVVRALEAENAGGSGSLVADALSLFLAILQRPVFRPHWADMLHLQHYVMLHALRLLSTTLRDRLYSTEDSDTETLTAIHSLCRTWFEAGAALATSSPLQLETLPAARKQRLSALYGDVLFDHHKRSFIPCLVGPFLEVSFLRDEEVRNTTIPIFFDMMQTEYSHSVLNGEANESPLKELESEMIDKVDVLVEKGYGDSVWRARFVSLCGALCGAASGPLRVAAAALVAAAARQLDALLQYRAAARRSATPHRMHLTTCVLHFYQQIERPHMYIRYVHKLAKMHHAAQQWAEAGLSLRLHAKLLAWSHDPLPPRLRHPTIEHDSHTTHRELKEYLYLVIADLLNRGRQWELAVEIVKELVSVYEEEALGYGPLADLHTQLASMYDAMLRTPRSHPGYFRVVYHGKGFPELLRTPYGYIYRGNEYEQLQEFKDRLLDEWPDAEVLPKLDPPGPEITESDGQYDLSNQNEFATRWLERTELEISEKLPGILDPAVQGGIVNYERAFLTPAYEARHPDHAPLLTELKDLIADQIPLPGCARIPRVCGYGGDAGPSVEMFPKGTATRSPKIRKKGIVVRVSKIATVFFLKQSLLSSTQQSEVGTQASGSQWYTSHATPNGSLNNSTSTVNNTSTSNNNNSITSINTQTDTPSASPLRELRQEVRQVPKLVTERPLRAEVERERRLSQRTSLITSSAPPSNRDSMGTTDSNQEEEEPPPLPKKYAHRSMDLDSDTNNNGESNPLPPRHNYDTVWAPRGSFLYNSIAHRKNTTNDKAPTPPPKKRNAQ
ncbi:hypothetical protein HF086_009085 [Spodoptera exigua]|uniref:DOCKER domain-containing protein n=1 Tax=Spodoptera exigua TaxID=7107 RepID=A0A922M5S5_SPOEX|nr:hypothetical protein HF086_009085 [Spodoptera exigua]